MPKRLKLFFLITMLFCGQTGFRSCSAIAQMVGQTDSGSVESGDLKGNVAISACLLTLMFLGVYQAQVDQMPESLKSQFKPQNMALNFASTYCMNFTCTFFHELGHGIAKKILVDSDFKIHLGKNSSRITCPIIDSKYLSIDGFDPMSGFNSSESCNLVRYSSLQKILINLAGGASGILGYYFLRTFIFFIYNLYEQKNTRILQNLGNALSQAVVVDQIVLNQLFNMFIPMAQNSSQFGGDAAKVWQELGIKNNVIKSVADIQPFLQMFAFIALSFKQSGSDQTDQRYMADKILIGLANYFLQGLGQFKSA
ncbi:MAG: hypothetical protein V1646_00705 [bacterium]